MNSWLLREYQYTFMLLYRSILLRMRIASDKRCSENQNTVYVQYF